MNFESVFLGPQSIQVCHLRSKTPLTSVDRLRGPPRRSNVDRIFANHPFPTLCSPRPFAGREEWATRRGARRPPLLRAPPRPWRCSPADPSPRPAPRAEVPWPPPSPSSRARARPGPPPPPAHGPPPRATRPCPTARAQLRLAAHLPWLPETRVGAAAGLLRGGPAMAARSGRARAGLPWSRRGGPGHPASAAPRVQGRAGDPWRSPSRLHLHLARARPSRGRGRREQREARRRRPPHILRAASASARASSRWGGAASRGGAARLAALREQGGCSPAARSRPCSPRSRGRGGAMLCPP